MISNQVKLFRGVASALSAATNAAIMGAMLYYLQPQRNPGMARPEDMYEKLVIYAFNRGSVFT